MRKCPGGDACKIKSEPSASKSNKQGAFSVLTATQNKYLQICLDYISEKITQEQLAQKYGVNRATVVRALKWGERNSLFARNAAEKIKRELATWRDHERWLESELRLAKRESRQEENRKRKPMHPYQISIISRELREVRKTIAELEGIYKETVRLEHSGPDGGPFETVVTFEQVLDE
jgi:hypothetical protein